MVISIETIVIIALVFFIIGMTTGVKMARPRIDR